MKRNIYIACFCIPAGFDFYGRFWPAPLCFPTSAFHRTGPAVSPGRPLCRQLVRATLRGGDVAELSPKKKSTCNASAFGGGSWIRTSEVSDNRFTVCPLWPLGNSPWSWWSELNQQPADYKSAALPLSHTSILYSFYNFCVLVLLILTCSLEDVVIIPHRRRAVNTFFKFFLIFKKILWV